MPRSNKYFTSKFFQERKSHEKIQPIVDSNTLDGQNGTRNELRDIGLRLCQEIAKIRGLPADFVIRVNSEVYSSIRNRAFHENEFISKNHRIIVCNALNEINILLRQFQTDPEKYEWASVSQQTMGCIDALGNCPGGRENAIKTLSKYLMDWKTAKDIAANRNQNEDDQDLLKKVEEEDLRIIIQKAKETLIYAKIDGLFATDSQSTHSIQRMKWLVYSDYGLSHAENDRWGWWEYYIAEHNALKTYVESQEFQQELISVVSSSMVNITPKPQPGQDDRSKKALEKIFDLHGLDYGLMYKDGEANEWNANIDSIIRLDSIKKMLPLGIFTEKAKKKLVTLTTPSVMKLVAVLGQNIQNENQLEGFVLNEMTYQYEKPNSAYQLPDFYSYDELLHHLNAARSSGKCEHFKEENVKQVINEREMNLHIVSNIDSYQITRLAHMIVNREKSGEEVSYRDFSSVLKYKVIKEKLHEIAAEVKRIQEKNGFIRTLEECYYAVLDFFRAILGMSTLDRHTKRDCTDFLYTNKVAEAGSNNIVKQSFVQLVDYKSQAAPQAIQV